jgi:hypothetical protein
MFFVNLLQEYEMLSPKSLSKEKQDENFLSKILG